MLLAGLAGIRSRRKSENLEEMVQVRKSHGDLLGVLAAELDCSLHWRYSWNAGITADSPPWVSCRASEGAPPGHPSEIPCASSLTCDSHHQHVDSMLNRANSMSISELDRMLQSYRQVKQAQQNRQSWCGNADREQYAGPIWCCSKPRQFSAISILFLIREHRKGPAHHTPQGAELRCRLPPGSAAAAQRWEAAQGQCLEAALAGSQGLRLGAQAPPFGV